jgi:hypothetical protein
MSVETNLSATQRDDLRTVAAMIIPTSSEYNVPGADDAAIQADMLATLGRDAPVVSAALDHLARLAGQPLASLDPARRDAVAQQFRASGGPARQRSRGWCCNATTATTACCARWGWSCGRHSRRDMNWSRATGRCSIRSRQGRQDRDGRVSKA